MTSLLIFMTAFILFLGLTAFLVTNKTVAKGATSAAAFRRKYLSAEAARSVANEEINESPVGSAFAFVAVFICFIHFFLTPVIG